MLEACVVRIDAGEVEGVDERGSELVLPVLHHHVLSRRVQPEEME